jgi:hypothetical protein
MIHSLLSIIKHQHLMPEINITITSALFTILHSDSDADTPPPLILFLDLQMAGG